MNNKSKYIEKQCQKNKHIEKSYCYFFGTFYVCKNCTRPIGTSSRAARFDKYTKITYE